MDRNLKRSAYDGFVGSFKLAVMLVVALVSVMSVFINGNGHDAQAHSRYLP